MGQETCVIVNPAAGRAEEGQELLDGHEALRGCDVQYTRDKRDMWEKARRAGERGYDLLIVAGGDGTLNEVINAIGGIDSMALGVLPLGTANDFARSLGIPLDLEGALGLLDRGKKRSVDVLRVFAEDETRLCVNVSAGGFSGAVDEELNAEVKQRWGTFAYLRTALEAMTEMESYEAVVRFDGGEEERLSVFNIAAANGRYVAGGIPVAPRALLDDGLLDIVVVRAGTLSNLAALAPRILLGEHLDDELIEYRRARRLEVSSSPLMSFNVDGELFAEGDIRFEVVPQALTFVAGHAEELPLTESTAA